MGSTHLAHERATIVSLIAAAQADPRNDSLAMEEIVRRYQPLTKRQARRIVREKHLHDDLSSAGDEETVKAVRRHDPDRPGFGSYIRQSTYRAAQRRCTQITRFHRAAQHQQIDDVELEHRYRDRVVDVDDLEQAISPWGTGSTHGAVATLPMKWQRILAMRYVEDLSNEEIGRREGGVSGSAISQTLTRAHDRLRSLLSDECTVEHLD